MDKEDWIAFGYAVVMGLCAAAVAWALISPEPDQQWTVKIEYVPPKESP